MSNITFSHDGSYFTVPADDKRVTAEHRYGTERWYPMPVPKAVQDDWGYISAETAGNYWLVRRPLPPLPKTQAELDLEAFCKWSWGYLTDNERANVKEGWFAGIHYERSRTKP